MNKKITASEFHNAIESQLFGLKPDPLLAQRIMSASENKRVPIIKKTTFTTAFIAVLLCILVPGALAAVLNAWGIIDFSGKYNDTYIPPRYEDCITKEDLTIDTERVICSIQESYYDGKILRVSAHIIPKEKVLIISGDVSPNDPVEDLFPDPESKAMSIAEYALIHFGGQIADISLNAPEDMSHDFFPHADGSATIYLECYFEEELPERQIDLTLTYMPFLVANPFNEEKVGAYDASSRENTTIPMAFHAVKEKRFFNNQSLYFASVGVKITNISMIVTPLEIRSTIQYVITDLNAYQAQNGGLWFEFIDPSSTETEYVAQRVSGGLSSGGSVGRMDHLHDLPDEVGVVYCQTDSIGLDALSHQYTIRAYNAWTKERFETQTFDVSETQ